MLRGRLLGAAPAAALAAGALLQGFHPALDGKALMVRLAGDAHNVIDRQVQFARLQQLLQSGLGVLEFFRRGKLADLTLEQPVDAGSALLQPVVAVQHHGVVNRDSSIHGPVRREPVGSQAAGRRFRVRGPGAPPRQQRVNAFKVAACDPTRRD